MPELDWLLRGAEPFPEFGIAAEELFRSTGRVIQTILRGRTVFKDGRIAAAPSGRLVKPKC